MEEAVTEQIMRSTNTSNGKYYMDNEKENADANSDRGKTRYSMKTDIIDIKTFIQQEQQKIGELKPFSNMENVS